MMGKYSQPHGIGITGSKGFIGTHLTKYLSLHGIEYVPFVGNLLNASDLRKYFIDHKIDQVIHLVGEFFPPFEQLIEKNLLTTQSLLKVGKEYGLRKIIYASSGAVYGEPKEKESLETDICVPNTLYGLSKKYTEECIEFYSHSYGLSYIILRFPNIYGPGNKQGVIANFLNDIKKSNQITVRGDGKQKRNFLHVEDACQALLKSISYDTDDVFNISVSKSYSVNELVAIFKKKYKFSVKYEPGDNNLQNLILNFDKARSTLGYVPAISTLKMD